MNAEVMRATIVDVFQDVWRDEKPDLGPPEITDDLVWTRTGLDSMAFAIFVARLDEELGYDPFSLDAEAFFPANFGEFVAFYERYLAHAPIL